MLRIAIIFAFTINLDISNGCRTVVNGRIRADRDFICADACTIDCRTAANHSLICCDARTINRGRTRCNAAICAIQFYLIAILADCYGAIGAADGDLLIPCTESDILRQIDGIFFAARGRIRSFGYTNIVRSGSDR